MPNKNMQLSKNHLIYKINDLSKINTEDILNSVQSMDCKIELKLFNIEQLQYFNSSGILELKHVHITLICSKQVFKMINFNDILKKSIMKNIQIENLQIEVNFYLCSQTDELILKNNMKIIDTINYSINDIIIKSKIHEVLYHANLILKDYKKQDNQIETLKNKMEILNDFVNKL